MQQLIQEPRLIMAKVEDGQSRTQLSLPILCTFDEHYSGEAAQKAKQMAMGILKSRAAFTHVTFEPVAQPDLEEALKSKLKLNPHALIHQRVYNPLDAQYRAYSEVELNGYTVKYLLKTSAFCSYAVAATPENAPTPSMNHLSNAGTTQIQVAS